MSEYKDICFKSFEYFIDTPGARGATVWNWCTETKPKWPRSTWSGASKIVWCSPAPAATKEKIGSSKSACQVNGQNNGYPCTFYDFHVLSNFLRTYYCDQGKNYWNFVSTYVWYFVMLSETLLSDVPEWIGHQEKYSRIGEIPLPHNNLMENTQSCQGFFLLYDHFIFWYNILHSKSLNTFRKNHNVFMLIKLVFHEKISYYVNMLQFALNTNISSIESTCIPEKIKSLPSYQRNQKTAHYSQNPRPCTTQPPPSDLHTSTSDRTPSPNFWIDL